MVKSLVIIKANERTYMSEISFIHLSDIHFRTSSGNASDIDKDLRDAIVRDIQYNVNANVQNIKGVLVGGDIAFCGHQTEYERAKEFLEEITTLLGIQKEDVYCVPGNHDVDQNIPRLSPSVRLAQEAIEKAPDIDTADWILEKQMTDPYNEKGVFVSIDNYNEFAALFSCNINSKNPIWIKYFELGEGMRLQLVGMNSCLISSSDDHKDDKVVRAMVIGQSQIPSYENDTVRMTLCHHPIEQWKFKEALQSRMDKRADIQLYGHKHVQTIEKDRDRLIVGAGAAHPVRGDDWNPRYNWISINCNTIDSDRVINVKVYPRILSSDRDRFVVDTELTLASLYYEFELNIDKKRKRYLSDEYKDQDVDTSIHMKARERENQIITDDLDVRKIIYEFFELSTHRQKEVLMELDLLSDENKEKRYIEIFDDIITKVSSEGKLSELSNLIESKKQ